VTLAQLRASLQAKGYGTDTATAQNEMLNSVYRRLCGRKRYRWQEAQGTIVTVAGTTSYATTFLHPDALRIEIGSEFPEMKYADYEDLRDLQHRDRDRGTPSFWTYGRGLLHIWPAPDRVYTMTVDYTLDPADLSADGDIPILPVTYHDILVWGAIKEIAFRQRDWAAHQYATKEFDDRLHDMEAETGIKQRQSSSHVKSSGFYDGFRKTW
jgi:hypothetical protein